MNKNFVCKCGHILHEHRTFYKKEKYAQCWICAGKGDWCEQFAGDNLKSLENLIK